LFSKHPPSFVDRDYRALGVKDRNMGRQTIESGTQECFGLDAAGDKLWGGMRLLTPSTVPDAC